MADPDQLAFLKRSVEEWNAWRAVHPYVKVELRDAVLNMADLAHANLAGANLRRATFYKADLSEANLKGADLYLAGFLRANLSKANLSKANLMKASLIRATLYKANLSGANLNGTDLSKANLTDVKWNAPPSKDAIPEPHSNQSRSPTDWLNLIETIGNNLLVTTATLASIIQGLDVVERRWREHQEKHLQQSTQTPQPASASSTQQAVSSSQKTPTPDTEIVEILLVMDDDTKHGFKRWISDPDALKAYIDAFSDPTSKVKPR